MVKLELNQEAVDGKYKPQKPRGGSDYNCDSVLLPVFFLFQEMCRNESLLVLRLEHMILENQNKFWKHEVNLILLQNLLVFGK